MRTKTVAKILNQVRASTNKTVVIATCNKRLWIAMQKLINNGYFKETWNNDGVYQFELIKDITNV